MTFSSRTNPSAPARPSIRHSKNPSLAPDGSLLAAVVVDETGYPYVVQRTLRVTDDAGNAIAGGERRADDRFDEEKQERRVVLPTSGPVRRVAYSHGGKWLACEVSPDGGERDQIWLVSTDPDDTSAYSPDRLADATVEIVCWDENTLALNAIDAEGVAEGRLASPNSEAMTVIDRRLGGHLVYVRDSTALFRVGSRGSRELLHIRPDGSWSPLLPPDPGSTTDAGAVLDSGRESGVMRALVRSDHRGKRMRLLDVRVGPEDTQVEELAARPDADLDSFAVSWDSSTAVLLWNYDGRSQLQILDLRGDEPVDLPAPKLPTAVVSSPSLTTDGGLLTFCVEGPEFPPRVVLWDVTAGCWTGEVPGEEPEPDEQEPAIGSPGPLAYRDQKLTDDGSVGASDDDASRAEEDSEPLTVLTDSDRATFVPELIRFPARDGLELTAWVYRAGDGPRPTWVYFHGGPEGQSRPGYNNVLRQVVDAGFTVVCPNVRGSSGQGRAFSHADERYARVSGLDDVADTVNYLVEAGISQANRLVVGGRSYGGYLTMATLVRHPQLWRGGIAACGMSDLETFYRNTEPWIAVAAYPKYGHPLQERELLQELSPIHGLADVSVPVLFVHGANDTNVPPSESTQALEVLQQAGTPADLLLFDDEGHEFVKRANRHVLGDRVEAFLKEVLN